MTLFQNVQWKLLDNVRIFRFSGISELWQPCNTQSYPYICSQREGKDSIVLVFTTASVRCTYMLLSCKFCFISSGFLRITVYHTLMTIFTLLLTLTNIILLFLFLFLLSFSYLLTLTLYIYHCFNWSAIIKLESS